MPKALSDPKSNGRNTVALDSHALGTLQYIRASIDAAGLTLSQFDELSARNEDYAPVPGLVVVAEKS